jgi:hypothetical protein
MAHPQKSRKHERTKSFKKAVIAYLIELPGIRRRADQRDCPEGLALRQVVVIRVRLDDDNKLELLPHMRATSASAASKPSQILLVLASRLNRA